ncbi:hypothetical protein J7L05_07430 [bacterium]|nr:hypothetical protein [bacterium]
MAISDKEKQKENTIENEDRVRFGVKIMSYGIVVFQDVPSDLFDILKSLYPVDPQTLKAINASKHIKDNP